MKQKDIIVIIVIIFVAGFASFFLSNLLFGGDKKEQTAEKVDAIVSDFKQPNKKYFNENSINPAQQVEVIDNTNQNPFGN